MMRIILAMCIISAVYAAPRKDLITSLPGLTGETTSKHYSGYLQASAERFHFYWFVESQSNPETDPLILWLNGGPGCSSLLGFFTELGPYTINETNFDLIENIYAWNTVSNVLFMESPVCVGYSYTTADDPSSCRSGDITTAEENYEALKHFFAKFPEYQVNDFYIIGESYAGIYIPTLSVHVVDNQEDFPINFKGIGLGNALISYENNDNSMLFYANYHVMFDKGHWSRLIEECCDGGIESRFTCEFYDAKTEKCKVEVAAAFNIIYYSDINFYNVIGDCQGLPQSSMTQYDADLSSLFRKNQNIISSKSDPPCLDYTTERNYLNRQETRDALHVSPSSGTWSVCDNVVGMQYKRDYEHVRSQISYLLEKGIKCLVYNGDTDAAVNVMGNEWDITLLGISETEKTRTWEVNKQVAGFVHDFGNLTFLTVRGSGHMVPEDKPPEALHMFISFINDKPY